jgi:hypothetical protein
MAVSSQQPRAIRSFSILNDSNSFFKEASMPATASLAKFILGGIAASFVVTCLFAAAPSSSAQAVAAPTDGSHTHKGVRLPLVHAAGPSFTVSAPSVGKLGNSGVEIDGLNPSEHVLDRSDAAANTTVAFKNVTVVGQAIDVLTTAKLLNGADRDPQDPSQKPTPARPVSCDAGTKPLADPILRRLDGRCFA